MKGIRSTPFRRLMASAWMFSLVLVLAGGWVRDNTPKKNTPPHPGHNLEEWVLCNPGNQAAQADLPEMRFWPMALPPVSFGLAARLFTQTLGHYQAIHESTKPHWIRVLQTSVSINAP